MLERPAEGARPIDRPEQFVEQVPVAVLHVDEVEARVGREHRRIDVGARRARRGRRPRARRSPSAATRRSSTGMVVRDQRLRRAGRPGPTPGMRELEADDQTVVAPDAPRRAHRRDRRATPRGRRRSRGRGRAGAGWRARRAARRPLRHPRRASLRSRRSGASGGARGPRVVRRPRRPTLPWAAPRTGCPRCARRSSRRRTRRGCARGPCGSTASSTPSWSAMPSTASRARSSSIVRRRFTWTISSPVTATTPGAARCRRGPRGRCRDVGVRRAVSCPSRCDRGAAGTAPRRVGTRGPVPGTRTRRGTGGGR